MTEARDIVFKGMTREAYLFGVPMVPLVLGGGAILIVGLAVWLPFLLFFVFYYVVLYALTKDDEGFFGVIKNYFKTASFKADKYNKVKTYKTTPKYRKLNKKTKISIHPINEIIRLQEFIPYSTHISKKVVTTKNNQYISTWAIDGTLFDMIEEYHLLGEKSSLNMLIRTLSSQNVSIYTHSIMLPHSDILSLEYEEGYLYDFAKEYQENINKQDMHISLKYLTVVYTPLSNKIEIGQFARMSIDAKEKKIKSFIFQMNEISERIKASFGKYGISELGIYEENGIKYSTLLEFFNYLVGGKFKKIKVLDYPIDDYLTGGVTALKFNKSIMQLEYSDETKRYAKSLEIKDFCSETYIGILDSLLDSQITYTVTQSFTPMNKREAKEKLVLQKRRLIGTEDDGVSQIEQLSNAIDSLISDQLSFGYYHFSIVVYADSILQLKKDTESVTVKLEDMGHLVTQSDIAFPATYFSQFPSNFEYRPRLVPISSLNFSAFLSFHTYLFGRRDSNPWGEAVCMLNTPFNTPYYLNLHTEESKDDFGKFVLGNSLIIGQSGTGKTAFMSFLLNMMMKYNNKNTFPTGIREEYKSFTAVYLDKKYGSMANILAAGGKYIILNNGEDTGFNPFMCKNTKENIRKLEILVKMMIGNSIEIKATQEKKISDAINTVMTLFKMEDRRYPISLLIENIAENKDAENSIKKALEIWTNGEKFGWIFDNEIDKFRIDDNNIIGIDGTEFLDDKEIGPIMSFYILWRILELKDGRRYGIWIDEAWKWIENENVAEEVHNSFKTNRSFNNFIIMGVQSVIDFLGNKYARAIIEQSATIFLFGNPKAVKEDYIKGLSCNEEEYQRVKNFNLSEHNFLIKRNEGSVIASLNLSQMDDFYVNTISTDRVDVEPLMDIFKEKENVTHKEKLENLKEYWKGKYNV